MGRRSLFSVSYANIGLRTCGRFVYDGGAFTWLGFSDLCFAALTLILLFIFTKSYTCNYYNYNKIKK